MSIHFNIYLSSVSFAVFKAFWRQLKRGKFNIIVIDYCSNVFMLCYCDDVHTRADFFIYLRSVSLFTSEWLCSTDPGWTQGESEAGCRNYRPEPSTRTTGGLLLQDRGGKPHWGLHHLWEVIMSESNLAASRPRRKEEKSNCGTFKQVLFPVLTFKLWETFCCCTIDRWLHSSSFMHLDWMYQSGLMHEWRLG